ncbi:multidrug resistance protein MsbA [Xenorhabdus mauleonii]|uniref:ATP-binding cassette, subfamily B n=1 Tax=Xenorhabdus mauleonii TaxID=351675 RepID=A0A1I3T2K4_9GAMM|nr:ABC transporter ATP-binding protein [Xenorhabdus mauleonii]PHM44692.1 multidrug resistance protein MsbA [Xenorhabdus mauleonii]SFJ64409.1 ATP-binding cassette, subfamily B [Xenorhabdus mauleonii]
MTVLTHFFPSKMLSALLGLVRKFSFLYFISMVVWTLIHGLPLVVGFAISRLLDSAVIDPVGSEVWWLLGLAVGTMVLRSAILILGLQVDFTLIFKVSAYLKKRILEGINSHFSVTGLHLPQGDMLNRIRNDSDEVASFLGWTADFFYRAVLLLIALVVLLSTDIVTTLALLPMVGGLWLGVILKNKVGALQEEKRQYQGQIAGRITDILTGIRDLRLSGKLDLHIERLSTSFEHRRMVQAKHQMFTDLLSGLFRNIVMLGTSIVLIVVSTRIISGDFTIGKLALFLTYIGWVSEQIFFFGRVLANYKNADVCYERIKPLLQIEQSDNEAPITDDTLKSLTVSGLCCNSDTQPISFSAIPNQLIVVNGEVGSGKSRMLRSLLALERSLSGSVLWNDKEVCGNAHWWQSPKVVYARQGAGFIGGTVRENLALGNHSISDETMERALTAVYLKPGSPDLPEGLDTVLGSGGARQLSGGQRQRLTLARMLCHPAEVYVVDDCDSSLDADTARAIWLLLPKQWPGLWIVASQNFDLLAQADQVVTIKRRSEKHEL